MFIWKRSYNPFTIGGKIRYNMKTQIEEQPIIDLGKGFKGVYIKDEGVFELESGGLVGDTIENVRADIESCEDIEFMKEQIVEAKNELLTAIEVSNEKFFEKNKICG